MIIKGNGSTIRCGLRTPTICKETAKMKLSEELLDHVDGAEESRGNDSRLTRWADMAQSLEAVKLPAGLSITSGSDGVWFHFDNGQGQKAMLNIGAVVQESYIIRAAVTGWAERFAAQREVSK